MVMVKFILLFQAIPVNAMVLSAQFWPTFREEKVTLPDQLQKSLDMYTERYKALKGNRTLCWKPHLGQSYTERYKALKGNRTLCWKPHLGQSQQRIYYTRNTAHIFSCVILFVGFLVEDEKASHLRIF